MTVTTIICYGFEKEEADYVRRHVNQINKDVVVIETKQYDPEADVFVHLRACDEFAALFPGEVKLPSNVYLWPCTPPLSETVWRYAHPKPPGVTNLPHCS